MPKERKLAQDEYLLPARREVSYDNDGEITFEETWYVIRKRNSSRESVAVSRESEATAPATTKTDKPKRKRTSKAAVKPDKISYAEFVTLTADEHAKLVEQLGETGAARCIDILNNHKGASGQKYKSDYHAILKWVIDAYNKQQDKPPTVSAPEMSRFADTQNAYDTLLQSGYYE